MALSRRTTDYGTVVLHVGLVVLFGILTATGMRIATDDPAGAWISVLDPILPVHNLWFNHSVAGVGLMVMLAAYAVYLVRARLTTRVRLDRARLLAIFRPGRSRWAALNVLVYWVLIGALATEVVTGLMLFRGAGKWVLAVHLNATFVCLGAIATHVVLHAAYGGLGQMLRIVRPSQLHVAAPPPDLAELLAEQLAARAQGETPRAAKADVATATDQRRPAVHPMVTAAVLAVTVGGAAIAAEQVTRQTLRVAEIKADEIPKLDGDISDPAWTKVKPVSVLTTQGGDFGGTRQSLVQIRALHDGQFVYMSFVWEDPSRSLKHLPLVKRDGRWYVVASRSDLLDETVYHEDKFAVLVTRPVLPLIGAAIHLARQPVADKPPSVSGRGLHYTTDTSIADVWQWRATHGGPMGHIDNAHFGSAAHVATGEPDEKAAPHYTGGFALDGPQVPYQPNFIKGSAADTQSPVVPRRLPRDPALMAAALGRISNSAKESDGANARWWMTIGESVPYTAALDAKIPDGTVLPGILMQDAIDLSRDSIRGTARWAAGRWTLEIARRLYTGNSKDVAIKSGVMLWVAAFDHAEKRHTRHLRPLKLEVD